VGRMLNIRPLCSIGGMEVDRIHGFFFSVVIYC